MIISQSLVGSTNNQSESSRLYDNGSGTKKKNNSTPNFGGSEILVLLESVNGKNICSCCVLIFFGSYINVNYAYYYCYYYHYHYYYYYYTIYRGQLFPGKVLLLLMIFVSLSDQFLGTNKKLTQKIKDDFNFFYESSKSLLGKSSDPIDQFYISSISLLRCNGAYCRM